jgi:thiosulfate/3-mercaptopyruvate sulfurtransferase
VTHTTLVSTDTLAARLDDRSWVLLDCRFDLAREAWGREQYVAAHIPGARYVSLTRDLSTVPTGSNGRHPLPSPDAMAATFGRLGVSRDTQVVPYDQDNGMYASRCWWMLRYMGHDAVAVLDGGWAKWVREGRPVRGGEETGTAVVFTGAPRDGFRLDVAGVESVARSRAALLVDARAPERFEGRTEPIDRVAGHIPGAVNHHYQSNVAADGTMLPAEQLRDRFTSLLEGRSPDEVVVYCGSGVTACHNLLAMEHAGLSGGRLFPGSWSEWSADPRRPVETGQAK